MKSRRGFLALLSTGVAFTSGCSFAARGERDNPGSSPSPGGPGGKPTDPTKTPGGATTRTPTPSSDVSLTDDGTRFRTLDIRDFGAAVNGKTDDTEAVRKAIDNANPYDTVLFPPGKTRVSGIDTPRGAAVPLHGDSIPEGLTLAGQGHESVVKMGGGQPRYHNVLFVWIEGGVEGLTIRDLRIDGNRSQQGQDGSGGHCIVSDGADSADVPVDVLIHNVWVENSNSSGITPRHGGFTIDRCTVRNCAKHGLSPDSASGVRKYDPPIVIRRTLATGNGQDGVANTYGIDCSGGKILVEDTVCANNAQGTKTTEQGVEITYRRVRLQNNDVFGYIRAGGSTNDRTQVTFEDVVSEGNGQSGFRFSEDTDYHIPTEIVATRNDADNIWLANDAAVEGETIWASKARNAYGLAVQPDARGKIQNYYHFENDAGAIEQLGDFDIVNDESRNKTDITGVPRAYQVGAGTAYTDPGVTK